MMGKQAPRAEREARLADWLLQPMLMGRRQIKTLQRQTGAISGGAQSSTAVPIVASGFPWLAGPAQPYAAGQGDRRAVSKPWIVTQAPRGARFGTGRPSWGCAVQTSARPAGTDGIARARRHRQRPDGTHVPKHVRVHAILTSQRTIRPSTWWADAVADAGAHADAAGPDDHHTWRGLPKQATEQVADGGSRRQPICPWALSYATRVARPWRSRGQMDAERESRVAGMKTHAAIVFVPQTRPEQVEILRGRTTKSIPRACINL
ncbi:hypothetical protein CDD83_4692 [Cordyceps sp. RAO-2017]|nr:hypothetical protein CDD83_4692 [Cordyceps sp. RAO-2017]